MTQDPAAIEARTVEGWFTAARLRQSQHHGPMPPRSMVEMIRTMAAYMGMTPSAAEAAGLKMAFWQMFLPSAMGTDRANFAAVRDRMPRSFGVVRGGVAAHSAPPQLIYAAYHVVGFPLLAAMLIPAVGEVHGSRGHVLVAHRNMAWLQSDSGRWVAELADVISTDPRGLRQLQTGLRDGSIRRLLILVDGPSPPGPGTHPLTSIGTTLGFKTALLRKLIEMRIPILPVTHIWGEHGLEIEWQPLLPADPAAAFAATAALLESILRRHPEQWVNWNAARAVLAPTPSAPPSR
jgi:hypothetical protein